ncbi:MAG: tetratricopeptide repeat protein, partial [Opitutae bacterium]
MNTGLRGDRHEQLRFEVATKLRQTEKYQLIVAQRFFAKGDFKAAMAEFEKFLTLYERSQAAPYAQIMWSHCLIRQRKQNTAIRDGYQSVIDYWPESPEAALAAYLIGKTYKDIGEVKNSIKAFDKVREDYPDKHVSVLSLWEILDIAKVHKDEKLRIKFLKELTFDIKRTNANDYHL